MRQRTQAKSPEVCLVGPSPACWRAKRLVARLADHGPHERRDLGPDDPRHQVGDSGRQGGPWSTMAPRGRPFSGRLEALRLAISFVERRRFVQRSFVSFPSAGDFL